MPLRMEGRQDNARRSGLVAVVLLVWRGIRVVAGGNRLRPVAGQPCAAAA